MRGHFAPVLIAFVVCLLSIAPTAHAQGGIEIGEDKAALNFPESVTFLAAFTAPADIKSVVLEYGVEQRTCGVVVAKAFPAFTPAASVTVQWTWEMRQSGSLPPGATLWWRWRVQGAHGQEYTTPQQNILWLDEIHDWKTVGGGNIRLHYYAGSEKFATALHQAAVDALNRLKQDVGIRPEKAVDIYIYATTSDMREAVLYEPGWAGGQAYPEHNIVIIGVAPEDLEWGKRAVAHELTHVLIGQRAFSCLGSLPTWLSEGLAMYGEGGLETYQQDLLNQAIAGDTLIPLRALTGGFSEESTRATLSYAQSYSVVAFLIRQYGRARMDSLLSRLSEGSTVDEALQAVYSLDTDGLEDAWRKAIHARPRAGGAQPTPRPTPTAVPTIAPISGVPAASVNSPTPLPTLPRPTVTPGESPPAADKAATSTPAAFGFPFQLDKGIATFVGLAVACCVIALLAIGIPVLVTLRRRRRKAS